MGQKVNPVGLRLGIVKTWESKWFGGRNYAEYILEDYKLRKFIKEKLFHAGVSRIESRIGLDYILDQCPPFGPNLSTEGTDDPGR